MDPKPLRVDSKDGAAPAPTPPQEKFVRKLEHPYFELRTPDSQSSSYLEGNALKMITDDQEKLSRFLAEPKLVVDQNTTPKKRSIRYQIDPEKYKNIRPLDSIPASELKAFEDAAKDFYDKAAPDRKDVHPYESFLRLNFKLPDPDKEPDAYLVYGDDFERQMLVLWGCEKEKGSALAVAKHEVVRLTRGEEPVTEKLRRKLIGWEQMQKDALLLLAKTREPLFRFIGQPVVDEQGVLKGVKIGEIALPANKTRPLRYLLPPEMKLFYKACQEFYNRAANATSSYEKELRKNFQLPDLEKMPGAFRVHGPMNQPRLIVLCDGTTKRDQTIWLTPSPDFNIPPMPPITPEQELLGHKPVPPPTLTDQLQRKTIPFAKIFSVAAGIVATPLLLAFLVWLALDKSPPKPVKVVPGPDATSILVRFNKTIDEASIPKDAALLRKSFSLVNSNSGPVTVVSAALDATGDFKNREIKLVAGEPFSDGTIYGISIVGLKDRALLHNQMIKKIPFGFVYADDKPPVLGTPSGDGESLGHLVLPFSKQMDAASIADVGDYSIEGFSVTSATLDEDKKTVILGISPDLTLKNNYTLVVKNVKDASKGGNKLKPDPTTVDFKFVDTLPPKLRHVTAQEQNQVVLEFNEKLNPATVTNVANYSLTRQKDGTKLQVYFAQLMDPNDPKRVEIFTTPLNADIDYDLAVEKVGDVAEPSNLINPPVHQAFKLPAEKENHNLPGIESLDQSPDKSKITVHFGAANRLRPDLKLGREAFALKQSMNGQDVDKTATISSVSDVAVTGYPPGVERVSLSLSTPLEKAQNYTVSARGLQDIWGNSNAVSDHVLVVRGFITPLQPQGFKFADQGKRTIQLTFNWAIDESSLVAENFQVPGRKVTGVRYGPNPYILNLTLDNPVAATRFSVACSNLRLAGSSVVAPALECIGPDGTK